MALIEYLRGHTYLASTMTSRRLTERHTAGMLAKRAVAMCPPPEPNRTGDVRRYVPHVPALPRLAPFLAPVTAMHLGV
jgi:hypothetical protein